MGVIGKTKKAAKAKAKAKALKELQEIPAGQPDANSQLASAPASNSQAVSAPASNSQLVAVEQPDLEMQLAPFDSNRNTERRNNKMQWKSMSRALKLLPPDSPALLTYGGLSRAAKSGFLQSWIVDPTWDFVTIKKTKTSSSSREHLTFIEFKTKVQLRRIMGKKGALMHVKAMIASGRIKTTEPEP